MMPRFIPILRPAGEPGEIVRGLLLGDALTLPIHYDGGAFPCLGHQCRYAQNGRCLRQAPARHYIPALKCSETKFELTAKELAAIADEQRRWREGGRIGPSPETRSAVRVVVAPLNPIVWGIAEVLDRAFDEFPKPLRGNVYSLAKIKGRLVYKAWAPSEVMKPLPEPFDMTPYLERVFSMPIMPVPEDGEIVEKPDVIKFPIRRAN